MNFLTNFSKNDKIQRYSFRIKTWKLSFDSERFCGGQFLLCAKQQVSPKLN